MFGAKGFGQFGPLRLRFELEQAEGASKTVLQAVQAGDCFAFGCFWAGAVEFCGLALGGAADGTCGTHATFIAGGRSFGYEIRG